MLGAVMTKSSFWVPSLYAVFGLFDTGNVALINFETVPGSSPTDYPAISTQDQADYGVTFE